MNLPNFEKVNGLIPAVIQDYRTKKVLMLGYMNQEAYEKTLEEEVVWFYSRSKQRLWKKGESSGNTLKLVKLGLDCDQDAVLVQCIPTGPVCHKGNDTCWGKKNQPKNIDFLLELEEIIEDRRKKPKSNSYTSKLFERGINKIAQKVGEEAVETVIEAKDNNSSLFLNECADLIFHLMILIKAKGHKISDVAKILKRRHFKAS